MDILIIPKGTTVKIAELPFTLTEDTTVLGRKENIQIKGVRIIGVVAEANTKKP